MYVYQVVDDDGSWGYGRFGDGFKEGKVEAQVSWNGARQISSHRTSSTVTIISATQGDGSKEK
jgi:hypothetical protein